jgi:CBS domain containing-hemolysin-like protein
MSLWVYTIGVMGLCAALTVISYLDRVYSELGRVTTGNVHDNLDIFAAEVEPRLRLDRRGATLTFRLLSHLLLVLVAAMTIVAAARSADTVWESALQEVVLPITEVFFFMHLIPYLLLTHSTGRWLGPFIPVLRMLSFLVWPMRTLLEVGVSVAHLHEEKPAEGQAEQEGFEAMVEAAEDQGILEPHDTELIEQVVEFGDKHVRDVMTPRPDVVAIPASASLGELRRLLVERKYSRVPVYEGSLDEIIGIAYGRELLDIPEADAARRKVREIVRPVIFVPETKLGSELLRDFQKKKQQMAMAIDEYGNLAGLVTMEDLVEEIVGEIGDEDRRGAPDVVREPDGSLLVRGSVSIHHLEELLGFPIEREPEAAATTVAGMLNEIAGHVPASGEVIVTPRIRFEVLDANQRKVLRLRARMVAVPAEQPKSAEESAEKKTPPEKTATADSAAPRTGEEKAARATRSSR